MTQTANRPPLPQPLHWPILRPPLTTCDTCRDRLDDLMIVVMHDESDSAFLAQILVARHIAAKHPDAVPLPHTDGCHLCAHYERHGDSGLWNEHRVRGLFLPEATARLM
ncbi:hypothetical protein [Streptomyces glaucescens]|uniref:Uncharacterized protein n=1 Tax=Streptomyces glaucescens TaxID=1907 RepID=A0A089XKN7_STRGA|nr:hypothetical protein [Streptomyces glaucescens]AIS02527.1 hypothetical protein SGLAU_32985 [Streptomyces glaucescens]